MVMIKAKGYEFNVPAIRDSFNRRAQQFKNKIITTLKAVNLTDDDIEVKLEPVAIKNVQASASWFLNGFRLHYSYNGCSKYVENLFVVAKIIELEILSIADEVKTIEEFIADFSEEDNVSDERKEARELLGVDAGELDLALISKKYKDLARGYHPDMPNGDAEKFKAVNRAHKILKRELE